MDVGDFCPGIDAVGEGVDECVTFGFCDVGVDYSLVEVGYVSGCEGGGLGESFYVWVEGFAEVVFDGLGVDFVVCK